MENKTLKKISMVSVVLFSLLTCISGVLAWFNAVRTRDASSGNFNATLPESMSITFDLYYRDYNQAQVVKKTGSEDLDLSLQDYNTSVSQTNAVFNNILKFNISFNKIDEEKQTAKSINTLINCVTREIGGTYGVGPEGATRTYKDTSGYMFHYVKTGESEADFICDHISNLIQFKGFLYSYKIGETTYYFDSTKTIDYTSDTTLFTSATSIFSGISDMKTFVSGSSKTSTLSMNFGDIPYNAESVEYYIEYNYNGDLLNNYLRYCEYLKNREFGDTFDPSTASLNVTFLKDLKSIELNTED